MNDLELPLLELFTRLREAGLPLGIAEYQLALRALQSGFGIPDRAALANLCRTLWVKSIAEKLVFDYHFEQVMDQEAAALQKAEASTDGIVDTPQKLAAHWWHRFPPRIRYLALGGTLLLVGGLIWLIPKSQSQNCPAFTSAPVAEATVNKEYLYSIKAKACPNQAGDKLTLKVEDSPSWLEFNDDGKGTATLSGIPPKVQDHTVRLWDSKGNQLAELSPPGEVSQISFSLDGERLVTRLNNSTVYLWDRQGKQLAKGENFGGVSNIEFSPDGQHLVTQNYDEFHLWNIEGKKLVKLKSLSGVDKFEFSPNQESLVTFSQNGTARLWNQQGKKLTQEANWKPPRFVYDASFSPDGQSFATASKNDTVHLRDLAGNPLAQWSFPGRVDGSFIDSPDGKRLVTISEYGTVHLWDKQGKQIGKWNLPTWAYEIKLSADGKRLVTILRDRTVRLWSLEGKPLGKWKLPENIYGGAFSPDGEQLVTILKNQTVHLWSLEGKPLGKWKLPENIYGGEFSPDGEQLVTILKNHTAYLWDKQGKQLAQWKLPDRVYKVEFSPNGEQLVTILENHTAYLWNLKGNQLAQWKLPDGVDEVEFSPDGKRLITILADNTVRLWNLERKQVSELQLPDEVYRARFSQDKKRLLTLSKDDTVNLWNLKGKQLATLKPQGQSAGVHFSPDGKHLATATERGTIRLWDKQGNKLAQWKLKSSPEFESYPYYESTHRDSYDSERLVRWRNNHQRFDWNPFENSTKKKSPVKFSADGQHLVTLSQDGTVSLWNLAGKQIGQWKHPGGVYRAGFGHEGEHLVTLSEDAIARLWNLEENKLAEWKLPGGATQVEFSPDGERLVTVSEDGTASLWDKEGKQLADWKLKTSLASDNHTSDYSYSNEKKYPIKFSSDGKNLITLSEDGIVSLRDKQGKQLAQWELPDSVSQVEFSLDGERLVTISRDNTVHLWNLEGNSLKAWKVPGEVNSFSLNGECLLTFLENGTVRLWNLEGELLKEWKQEKGINPDSFNADSKHLIAKSRDHIFYLQDLAGKQLAILKHPIGENYDADISFSPDGERLVTLDYDTVKLWDKQGKLLKELKHEEQLVGIDGFNVNPDAAQCTISPDGERLITFSVSKNTVGTTHLWNKQGQPLKKWRAEKLVACNPETFSLATEARDGTIHLWDKDGKALRELKPETESEVRFSADGQHLITISTDGIVSLWDLKTNNPPKELSHQLGVGTHKVKFSPDGKYFIREAQEDTIHLWDLDGKKLPDLKLQGKFSDFVASPDGEYFAAASENGKAFLWDKTGKLLHTLEGHKGGISDIVFSLDGKRFATASGDGTALLWDLEGKTVMEKPLWPQGRVSQIRFSADGKRLTTISEDNTAILWDIEKSQPNLLRQLKVGQQLQFSENGNYLDTISSESIVNLWNLSGNPEGNQPKRLELPNTLDQIELSVDGNDLITTSKEGAVSLWDIQSGRSRPLKHDSEVEKTYFSPDGQYLATVFKDNLYPVKLRVTDAAGHEATQPFTLKALTDKEKTLQEIQEPKVPKATVINLILATFLAAIALPCAYIFARWWLKRQGEDRLPDESASPSPSSEEAAAPSLYATLTSELEDELQVVQAAGNLNRRDSDLVSSPLSEFNEYFPVTRRQMKQSWRYLRRFVREGPATELDVEATVNQIGHQGLLLKPIFVPRRINRTDLLLLVDRDGSMVPFHAFSERLRETALQGGRLGRADIYYFHNCPVTYVYHDPFHQQAEFMRDVLSEVRSDYTGMLIFSDAGAARGGLNLERIELTAAFLEQCRQQLRYIAWLNPMPRSQWVGTTAAAIARRVPMFECDRRGLQEAISVLRGKLFHDHFGI